jgi:hypothetical protein
MNTNRRVQSFGFVILFLGMFGVLFTMINIPQWQGDLTLEMFNRTRESYRFVFAFSTLVCFFGFGVIYMGREN